MSGEHAGRGRILVFTGDGKGKTTAALGLALRALGQGLRVCIVQFIKARRDVGEVIAAKRIGEHFEIITCGRGFVRTPGGTDEDREAAKAGLEHARRKAEQVDLLILDEVLEAIHIGLIREEDARELLANKPPALHVALTGRNAQQGLIDLADTVTRMDQIKHAYDAGTGPTCGIEF